MGMVKIISRFFKMRFKHNFEYKMDWVFVFLFSLTAVIFSPIFWFLLTGGREFNGWTFMELALLSIIYLTANSCIGFFGLFIARGDIKRKLTLYMTKPFNTLSYLFLVNLWYPMLFEISIYAISAILIISHYNITVHIVAFLIFFLFSMLVQILLLFIPYLVSLFWYDAGEDAKSIIWNLLYVSRNPLDKIKIGNLLLGMVIVPLLFVAVYPVKALTGQMGLDILFIIKISLVILIFGFVEYLLWLIGLKHYESLGG
ncbi:ABC-2 family transporter protein [Candidatus Micrarchaeota archaeon]|nr:ABC-2 family transporter protein [Candidatus Micrarchaeota archaeon]